MSPSKQFTDRQAEIDAEKADKESAEAMERTAVFWHRCKLGQVGNYQKEERYHSGDIKSREIPVRFFDHIFTTDKPDEIKFLEESDSFKAGTIKRAANMKEARAWTNQQAARKAGVREFKSELTTNEYIKDVSPDGGYVAEPVSEAVATGKA